MGALQAPPPSVQARIGQYVANNAKPTPRLPLPPASIFFLGNAQFEEIRPWGTPFRDTGGDANADRPHGGAKLQLALDRYEIGLGEPLDFSLKLTLDKNAEEIEIHGPLGLKFQTMEVRIETPSLLLAIENFSNHAPWRCAVTAAPFLRFPASLRAR